MSEFKREKRYQVIKLSNPNWKGSCVVVEDDWPEYEIVWKMIQDRIEGTPNIIEQQAEQIAELEERIRVADAEEPACVVITAVAKDGTAIIVDKKRKEYPWRIGEGSKLYLHAQIPANERA